MKVASPRVGTNPVARESLTKANRESAVAQGSPDGRQSAWPSTDNCCAQGVHTQTGDAQFTLNSLVAQVLFLTVREHIRASYGKSTGHHRRRVQTGYAWSNFRKSFEPLNAIESVRLFENLLRFANCEECGLSRSFFLAYAPLAFEHDATGEYIGPGVWTAQAGARLAAVRIRRTLRRWCDWLEALAHYEIHKLNPLSSAHPELDKLIIFVWPLVKKHNWSYFDLLRVLRSITNCWVNPACGSEAQLADYCRAALGLERNTGQLSHAEGPIAGVAVAERLCKFLPAVG